MGKKLSFRLTLAVLFSIFAISLTTFHGSSAHATRPITAVAYGTYNVGFSLAGVDFSGDRSIVMAYIEFSPEYAGGVAYLNHEGRRLKVRLECLFDEYSEDGVSSGGASYEGFIGMAGIIERVSGYTEDDIMFPKLFIPEAANKFPEVGDWAILGLKKGEGGDPDQATFPFVFAPVSFGLPVSCESLIVDGGPHGPPFSIIDFTYGDLDGRLKFRGL